VISSKTRILDDDVILCQRHRPRESGKIVRKLSVDYIDVYHLHAVHAKHYDYAMTELVPVLLRQKEKGTISISALRKRPPRDPDQTMLARALEDPCWEVIMLLSI